MTALPEVALLTGRLAPGVWRIETEPFDLEALAHGLGWDVRRIAVDTDKSVLIEGMKASLGLPVHVRGNWDSLADGLTDMARPLHDRLLVLADAASVPSHENLLLDIFADTVAFWGRGGVEIQVLWIGPGTAPPLVEIDPIRASRLDRAARTGRTLDR